jgi:large subunit ribosomal protein L25
MEQVTLAFQERKELKKSASRRLRVSGKIPAVVYGQEGAVSISVDAHEFSHRFASFGENTVIKLQNGKTVYEVLVKDYQDDVLSGQIQHIDFYHVSATKTLHARVPVHLTGTALGVRNGGLLEHVSHEIEVECLARDIPHNVTVDVSELDMNASIYVRDLKFAAGVKVLTNADTVVVHVISTRSLDSVPETEVTTAPAAEDAAAAGAAAAAPAAPGAKAAPAAKVQEKKA